MTITFNEVERILKTLPIGYYIKRKIEVALNNSAEYSYFDPFENKICISFQQLTKTFEPLKDINVEESIRGMLYHEVSHAFITPRSLKWSNIVNIVEDERIESVLRYYYMNVNFRELVKNVNHYNGEKPKTADEAFYHLVRFRVGSEEWLTKLHELIERYSNLTANASAHACWCYRNDIETFYEDFVKQFEEKQDKEIDEQSQANETKAKQLQNADNNLNSDQVIDVANNKIKEQIENEFSKENADELIDKSVNELIDVNMISDVQLILQRISKTNAKNGSAINSYSGVFDVRSVIRDDYKFFVQKNRLGHVKAYSNVHLNLFIDRSGSFTMSQKTVNKLLYALRCFEKQNSDFSFDLVTCGVGEQLEEKSNRLLFCNGRNDLDDAINDIFKKLQFAGQINYNIVLFDGDAFSGCSYHTEQSHKKNFGAFNTSNTTIISDYANKDAINKYATSARKIFTNNYVEELYKNVMIALQALSR